MEGFGRVVRKTNWQPPVNGGGALVDKFALMRLGGHGLRRERWVSGDMVDNHAFSALKRHFRETKIVVRSDAAAHLRSHAGPGTSEVLCVWSACLSRLSLRWSRSCSVQCSRDSVSLWR